MVVTTRLCSSKIGNRKQKTRNINVIKLLQNFQTGLQLWSLEISVWNLKLLVIWHLWPWFNTNKYMWCSDINKYLPGPHLDPPTKDRVKELIQVLRFFNLCFIVLRTQRYFVDTIILQRFNNVRKWHLLLIWKPKLAGNAFHGLAVVFYLFACLIVSSNHLLNDPIKIKVID